MLMLNALAYWDPWQKIYEKIIKPGDATKNYDIKLSDNGIVELNLKWVKIKFKGSRLNTFKETNLKK